jgi:hypothetical protein
MRDKMEGEENANRCLAKPRSRKTTTPSVFLSLARGWLVAPCSLASDSKQATEQLEVGLLEPGWELATQPKRPNVDKLGLVHPKNPKLFKIICHIESCGI